MLAQTGHSEFDVGPRRSGPERLCAVTREVRPVEEMIRFVAAPDGSAVPDLKRNLPGRGLWITASDAALSEAVRRKIFAKGLKTDVQAGPGLVEFTRTLLEKSALDALAIAGKAGQVASGFAKTEAAVADGNITAILHASTAAPDGVRKLDAALRRRFEAEAENIPSISEFSSEQLDLALGRSNVVHAALLAGPASGTFIARYQRMKRFRTGNPGKPDAINARRKPQGLESE